MNMLFITIGSIIVLLLEDRVWKSQKYKKNIFLPVVSFIVSILLSVVGGRYVRVYGEFVELVSQELVILRSIGILLFLNIPTIAFITLNIKDK